MCAKIRVVVHVQFLTNVACGGLGECGLRFSNDASYSAHKSKEPPRRSPKDRPLAVSTRNRMKMPTMWNLLWLCLAVAPVWASSSLEPPSIVNKVDSSSFLCHLAGSTSLCSANVTGWELIDTTTNNKVQDLVSGDIVYSDNPSFSIRAMVSGSGITSVRFTLDVGGYTHTETTAPYSLCTNSGRMYRRCKDLTYGTRTVTGMACCDRTCQATPTALVFEIRRPTPTKAPTKAPSKAPAKAPTRECPKFDWKDMCCQSNEILVKSTPFNQDTCCPPETMVVDSVLACCKPNDIVVSSPLAQAQFKFCCPTSTIAATFTPLNEPQCCPANTGVNMVTLECCPTGQATCSTAPTRAPSGQAPATAPVKVPTNQCPKFDWQGQCC
jgi:hypothetical protein